MKNEKTFGKLKINKYKYGNYFKNLVLNNLTILKNEYDKLNDNTGVIHLMELENEIFKHSKQVSFFEDNKKINIIVMSILNKKNKKHWKTQKTISYSDEMLKSDIELNKKDKFMKAITKLLVKN